MGDPLLARSRRMPRGFQCRFLRPLERAEAVDARLRLVSFLVHVAIQKYLNAHVRPPVTKYQAEPRPMSEEYS